MAEDPSHRHGYDRDSLMDWRKALPPRPAYRPTFVCKHCHGEIAADESGDYRLVSDVPDDAAWWSLKYCGEFAQPHEPIS